MVTDPPAGKGQDVPDVTQILVNWRDGDIDAPARLRPLGYKELRRRARDYLRRERPDHTLLATALVHEAYLGTVDHKKCGGKTEHNFTASPRASAPDSARAGASLTTFVIPSEAEGARCDIAR